MIRNALESEYGAIGELMVKVFSELEGFPSPAEQPEYYKMLANVGELIKKPGTEILVAVSDEQKISGTVVYFSEMKYYGSGGSATMEQNASGFRLLAVDNSQRGQGIGKLLTNECIKKARENKHLNVVIHTTKAMQTAWNMYGKIGFRRAEDLDFMQGSLPVFGFRLYLSI